MLPAGWRRVRLPVSAGPWLERLVLRLGPAPSGWSRPNLRWRSTWVDRAAARVLARYTVVRGAQRLS